MECECLSFCVALWWTPPEINPPSFTPWQLAQSTTDRHHTPGALTNVNIRHWGSIKGVLSVKWSHGLQWLKVESLFSAKHLFLCLTNTCIQQKYIPQFCIFLRACQHHVHIYSNAALTGPLPYGFNTWRGESKEVHLENSSHYLHWCNISMTRMGSHKQRRL